MFPGEQRRAKRPFLVAGSTVLPISNPESKCFGCAAEHWLNAGKKKKKTCLESTVFVYLQPRVLIYV